MFLHLAKIHIMERSEKKYKFIWSISVHFSIFATLSEESAKKFGLWCNGSTTGFGSVCPGSNPGSPTDKKRPKNISWGVLFLSYTY
jgi:hypothetical protein